MPIIRTLIINGILFFGLSATVLAKPVNQELLLLSTQYLNPTLEVVSDQPTKFSASDQGFLLHVSPGATHLISEFSHEHASYDRLLLTLTSDAPLEVTLIPKIGSAPKYTYELQRRIGAGTTSHVLNFSLKHKYFWNAEDFAIKFNTNQEATIVLERIVFIKLSFWQNLLEPVRQYVAVAPYSGFTVNVFPTPLIFGTSAFLFFIPIVLLFVLILFFWKKFQMVGFIGLLILWLITDARMSYEFLNYIQSDYRSWIAPRGEAKRMRTYGDYYAFADWLNMNVPASMKSIYLFYAPDEHFPRLMQYLLYPLLVVSEQNEANVWAVYHRQDVKDKLIATGTKELASFSADSGLFIHE